MTDPRDPEQQAPASTTKRLLWFVGLSLASLSVTALVAYGLRALLFIG